MLNFKSSENQKGREHMQEVERPFYRRLLFVLIAMFILFMLVNTLAFWTQELWLDNEYQLGKYSTKIEEEFASPMGWLPGESVNKDILIANDGTVPVFVKAQVNLNWLGQNDITGEPYGLTFTTKKAKEQEYAAIISWGNEVVLLSNGISFVDSLRLGLPLVDTIAEAAGKWLLLDEEPDKDGNFTFYYMGVLASDEKTPLLMDSVKLNPQIEATTMETHTIYNKEDQKWITEYLPNPSYSYENGKFLLTVNAWTVQATNDALGEVFVSNTLTEQAVVSYLGTVAIDQKPVVKKSKPDKTLYFEEHGDEMRFTPINSSGQKWFMSFLEMIPGGQYSDILTIENRSKNDYDLYMQVVPKANQDEMLKELLELIHMKVYLKDALIYDGNASGKEQYNSDNNLQKAVFLGEYTAAMKTQIRVELELSKETSMQYCELLTKVDWKFIATEIVNPEQPQSPPIIKHPQTGDMTTFAKYILSMSIATIGILACIYFLKRHQKGRGAK